jgi:hypothetical protein
VSILNPRIDPAEPRRSFMARLGGALAGATAAILATPVRAMPQTPAAPPWKPTRHLLDDWFDELPGQHRVFFDAVTGTGAGEALQFCSNFRTASQFGYQLGDGDNALVIGLRHWATPFAYSDAVWSKYGSIFSDRIHFVDPKTNTAPVINVYLTKGYGMQLPNRENTFPEAVQHRVHFAVCDMATRAMSGLIATQRQLKYEDVYAELRGSAHANSHFMAAGVVAVNRAQERGYAIQHIG